MPQLPPQPIIPPAPGVATPTPQVPQYGGMAPQIPGNPQQPAGPSPQSIQDQQEADLDLTLNSSNLASNLDDEELKKIGDAVVKGYDADLNSLTDWYDMVDTWMKLALQVAEDKTYPWQKAANVKYPLLTTAALQFGSRAYPSLVPSFDVVKAKVIGTDQTGMGEDTAATISTHMSYQILYEMENWEEDMDKLCLVLPIVGCVFKKTYFSQYKKQLCSELVLPTDLVINYWAKDLKSATRKTQKLWLTPNDILERQRLELFNEYDDFTFGPGSQTTRNQKSDENQKNSAPPSDEETPRLILEQHTFYDLDGDDYKEPYIITVDYESRRVLRITPRFSSKGVEFVKGKKKIARIIPDEYFTQFNFIPNPDGGLYGVGFGLLLGSINESANTVLNQLIDAGSLSNLQSGFITKGLRLGKAGDVKFTPGEWKWVNNTFDDLKKGVFPLPVREPSNVLFQLLGMLVSSGKELASIAEIFTGKMPGQNTPASTTMATIEQGLKVFTSIYKRIYRALGEEFTKLFNLNSIYLDIQPTAFSYDRDGIIVDGTVSRNMYKSAKVKILPSADPNMVSETQKLILLQGLEELAKFGHINTQELTKRGLEMQGQPGIAALMNVPPPQPPPELQIKMAEIKSREGIENKKLAIQAEEMHAQSMERMSNVYLRMAQAEQLSTDSNLAHLQTMVDAMMAQEQTHQSRIQMILDMLNQQADREMQQQQAQQGGANGNQQGGVS